MKLNDPAWAWSPYEPEQAWTVREVTHLLRRAGFGHTFARVEQVLTQTPHESVRQLVHERSETEQQQREYRSLVQSLLATANVENLPAGWLHRMLHSPDVLREKLTLFWHGHFATSGEKVTESKLMQQQNDLLRQHALGDFSELLHEISHDPAMLIYLDSVTNRKSHPNENYAREIMELFYLGEGNYEERDIRELARCFTGWEIRREKFRFNRYQHDSGEKTIFGETGNFSGEEGVDLVLAQPTGPEFIARKLVTFFVADDLPNLDQLVQPLAKQFREESLQIAPLVERILSSNLFFSQEAIARKIRSPLEFAIGFMRTLEGTTDVFGLANRISGLGQSVFFPPNVKGWDGGLTWINSSTLIARANLIRELLASKKTRFAGGSLSDFFAAQNAHNGKDVVAWCREMMFAVELPVEVSDQLARRIDAGTGSGEERLREAIHLMTTLPEYQLG